ncbi:MAG: hypothetical protein RLZZ507_181 [Cyanobacteriota bacterium]|jgi:diguanylate cyclase (GGDEF)-like protein
MIKRTDNHEAAKGEVSGSFLLGLIASFSNMNILPQELQIDELSPDQWYPYSMLIDILHRIQQTLDYSAIILFYAGVNFLRIWYENGLGKTMIHSGMDWLYVNQESGGYNSVVRGGGKDEIGWCILQSIDKDAGIAVYENITPLPPDFVRGVFYGGCVLFDDMEYVDIEATNEQYKPNPLFNNTTLTVRFRLKSKAISQNLDDRVNSLQLGHTTKLSPAEIETLIWRNKGLQVKIDLEIAYHKAIGLLLENFITTIKEKNQELTQLNAQTEYMANYDSLTGLPNRRLAIDRLRMISTHMARCGAKTAILFIDLDGFKVANDTFGHDAGDYVLKAVSERLLHCLRQEDTVSRLGGDEFLVIVHDVKNDDVAIIARKLVDVIAQPICYNEDLIHIGSSIGISIFPDHAITPEDLLNNADNAMYSVKMSGKNNFAFYTPH